MHWVWLEHLTKLTKPFASFFNPIAERAGQWLARWKPHVYVHFSPGQMIWCIATQKRSDGNNFEMMQATFWADFNHDDEKQTLIMTDAYPEGTRSQLALIDKFSIAPHQMVHRQIAAFVVPVVGQKGSPWTGQFVLVDQFQRQHKTKKAGFRWAGAPSPPATADRPIA